MRGGVTVLTAPNPGPFTLDGTRTYVVGSSSVIDPGPSIESHIEAVLAAAPRLSKIFVTHRHADHAPAALAIRQKTGARLFTPAGVFESETVDHLLQDGEIISLDESDTLEAIATPGHTAEHFCFIAGSGELFTGDTILGSGTTTIFPPDGDMASYLRSLRLLRERRPTRIYPGHGPVRDDAMPLIDYYIAHRLEREEQIVALLARGGKDIASLRESIYVDLPAALAGAAETQLSAHLIHLCEQKRVMRKGSRFALA
ncbi:MAG TPA: MBL fold metallo-hydrolase [Thermoanaerobaculia bacterium]|nr:MBL fold metallo-hydrolase [Thermoanaerobaculia bacterium]